VVYSDGSIYCYGEPEPELALAGASGPRESARSSVRGSGMFWDGEGL